MATSYHRSLLVGSVISPQQNNATNVTNSKEMNLIVNILWMVLLCGLIVSFGVFQVLRYVMKCRRAQLTTQTSENSVGLKKSVVTKMATRVLGSEVKILVTECTICLDDFVDGQNVRVLPHCGHEFHVECIDKWFESHSSCPNCRNCLLEHAGTSRVVIPPAVVVTSRENMV
uniref:RING-H2 finger protein ATL74-like n=1 Tax=Erigeron canadensis TaxID=72917 RepID=UPI001CB8B679|nr:RING-H2 finger protein ATL74-like [Erigeron canadensis]